jgi:flagellar basal-body rod modification protein FlgD
METGAILNNSSLGQGDFIQLFVAQMRHQDPLNPVSNENMFAQLTQFSMLDGINQLNASFSEVLTLQQLTEGSNLLGKTINYQSSEGAIQSGTVSGVEVEGGKIMLRVGDETVSLSQIQGIQ